MNPYQRRLNSFTPIMLAQAPLPGQAVGNMDGIPLEALQGTSSPEKLKREGLGKGPMPPGFGPISSEVPEPRYVTDIPIKAGYRNIYGTDINATYNPTTGAISGGATIPIGAAEKGYKVGVEGSYNPGLMDAQGITPPPGYSGMIRFSKTNPIDPKTFEAPGAEKYSVELGIEGNPRRVPPQRTLPTLPIQVGPPNPQVFQNLLDGR
jgi:hypothetical protein